MLGPLIRVPGAEAVELGTPLILSSTKLLINFREKKIYVILVISAVFLTLAYWNSRRDGK